MSLNSNDIVPGQGVPGFGKGLGVKKRYLSTIVKHGGVGGTLAPSTDSRQGTPHTKTSTIKYTDALTDGVPKLVRQPTYFIVAGACEVLP